MSTTSDPREWLRREERARERLRRPTSVRRPNRFNPIYLAAAILATFVALLLISAYGPPGFRFLP